MARSKIGPQFIRANADGDRVVLAQIAEGEGHIVKQIHANAELAQDFRQRIVLGGDIADVQARGHLQIQNVHLRDRRLAPVAVSAKSEGVQARC